MTSQSTKSIFYAQFEELRSEGKYDKAFFDELWPNLSGRERLEKEEMLLDSVCWYLSMKKGNPETFTNDAQNKMLTNLAKKAEALEQAYRKVLSSYHATHKLYQGYSREHQAGSQREQQVLDTVIGLREDGHTVICDPLLILAEKTKLAAEYGRKLKLEREGTTNDDMIFRWVKMIHKQWDQLNLPVHGFTVGEHMKLEKGGSVRKSDTPYLLHDIISIVDKTVTPEKIISSMRKI